MKINSLEDFLNLLEKVESLRGDEYRARCPAHEDKHPSLSVTESNGKILIYCHAGCKTREILKALNLRDSDLFLEDGDKPTRSDIVETYDYTDEDGKLLYQVCRTEDKQFPQRRPVADGWKWGLGNTRRVLYNLPNVREAIEENRFLFLVEGEKDADNLEKLGFTATCNPMGAGNWSDGYTDSLEDANVVILPDNDKEGRKHALEVSQLLQDKADSVEILELPDLPDKGDVSDWIEDGGTKNRLEELVREDAVEVGDWSLEVGEELTWEDVLSNFTGKDKNKKRGRFQAAKLVSSRRHFVSFRSDEPMLSYDPEKGLWRKPARHYVEKIVQEGLGENATRHDIEEIIGHVKRSSYQRKEGWEVDNPDLLNLQNGVFDPEKEKLYDHDPKYHFQTVLPVNYDPDASSEPLTTFLETTLREKDIPLIEEVAGFCLYREYFLRKAVMFIGEGGNGKTITLNLIKAMLGNENVTGYPLQQLSSTSSQFAQSSLYRKYSNIAGDLPGKSLRDTGVFKQLTGRDHITADVKYQREPLEFTNFAKLLFSTNNVPATPDDTEAFFDRWILVEFPYKFVENPTGENEKRKDPDMLEKITTEKAISSLFNRAVEGLKRLRRNGSFSFDKSGTQVRKQYQRLSQPIKAFTDDCLTEDEDNVVEKDEVYQAYREYCQNHELPVKVKSVFSRRLSKFIKVSGGRHRIDGERKQCYEGIRLEVAPF